MNQFRRTPKMQCLGDRQKRPDLAKLHLATLFAHLITGSKTNNNSNQMREYPTGCGKRGVRCHRTKGVKKMKFNFLQKQTSRRDILRGSVTLAGSTLLAHLFPTTLLRDTAMDNAQRAPSPTALLASMRAKFNAVPMETQKLADNVTMFDGPGGAVTVLNGPAGKFVVDTFVAPAWPRLKEALDGLGSAPVKYVIDTHWHFDHTDNNAHLHATGATVLAHETTTKRMSEPHDLPVLYRGADGALASLHFDPSPAEALPQQTFAPSYQLRANGETLALQHVALAHGFGYLRSFSKRQLDFDGRPIFQRHVSLHRPRYGRKNHRHYCRLRRNSLTGRQRHQACCGSRPARQQGGPHEISGHAGHIARSRREIEVSGKIRPRGRRGKALR